MSHSRPTRYTNWHLREWMKSLGVKQAELVDRSGLNKTAISLLCNDRQDYTPEIVRDIASALHLAPFELFMHPQDAMALRRLRQDALRVVEDSRMFDDQTSPDDAKITATG